MPKIPFQTLLALGVLGVGGLITAIAALFAFMTMTATPIHPDQVDVPTATDAAPAWAEAAARGEDLLRAGLVERNLPGLSVAVGVNGDIVWAEGMGWAEIESRVPVTPNTRFRIGSMATVLTSAAVGQLIEDGHLDLDAPIQDYVPDFPVKEWPITLRQLMAHTAGVRDDAGDEEPLSPHCEDAHGGLSRFADRPLLFEPGTRYRYSSYGWRLVSAAIENAAREPFFRYMRRQVFEPLGLTHTSPDLGDPPVSGEATSYFPRFAADTRYGPQGSSFEDHSCFSGSSAVLSTPSDVARFVMALDHGDATEDGRFLRPATVELLQTPVRLPDGSDTGYGLGWDFEVVTLGGRERRLIVHDGILRGGMVSSLISVPEHGLVVVVMANISFAETASLALAVADVFTTAIEGRQ